MLPFICCQSQGKAAFGNTQLTVDLEPNLRSGIVQRCFQPTDRGQRKVRNIGIQYHIPIVVTRAVDTQLNTGNAELPGLRGGNPHRELPQQNAKNQYQTQPSMYIPLFLIDDPHKTVPPQRSKSTFYRLRLHFIYFTIYQSAPVLACFYFCNCRFFIYFCW